MRPTARRASPLHLPLLIFCLWAATPARAAAGPVGVEYVKALGQSNHDGDPLLTFGGQLALDDDGNLYCGTPGASSRLQKLTPDGRVVWHHFHNVPGFQGVAIDDRYVYTCGAGYYGYRQVQRWNRASGVAAAGWQHEWKKDEPSDGVRAMKHPVALAVDDRYLYVADRGDEEFRRLEKRTGAEAPFGKRVMVVGPRGLARSPKGDLLILTAESLLEVDRDGRPLRVPLIDELRNAVALAVDPKRSLVYVAEGGPDAEPVNRVRAFDLADGKPTDFRLGAGGRFHGPWSPTSFAFFDGAGALAVAPDGGLWVNPGWAHHLGPVLPTLGRFDAAGGHQFTLRGVSPFAGIAADDALACYVGGTAKLSWDDRLVWTAGLASNGRPQNLPPGNPNWPTYPVRCGKRIFLHTPADGSIVEVNRDDGTPPGKPRALKPNSVVTGLPDALLILDPAKAAVLRLDPSLTSDPTPLVTLAGLPAAAASAAASDDGRTLVVHTRDGRVTAHALADGGVKWEAPAAKNAANVAVAGDYAFVARAGGAGVQVLRLSDGAAVATVGDAAVGARGPIPATADLAAVRRDDGTYLFVATAGAIRAYRL